MTPKDIAEKSKQYAREILPDWKDKEVASEYMSCCMGYEAGATAERESNTYGFAEWVEISGCVYLKTQKCWFVPMDVGKEYTTEQLFQLFLTTKPTTP